MERYLSSNIKINEALIAKDKAFIKVIDACKEIKINLSEDYFVSIVQNIVGQQLSIKVADVIFNRVVNLCNDDITPDSILYIPNEALREIGLSNSKVQYVKNLAQAVKDKKVIFENIDNMSDEEIIKMLTYVKGIGRWTAEMFLIFTLGREDVFSVGDAGLERGVAKIYDIEYKLSKEELNRISDTWKPYRTYATLYLWDFLKK